MSARGLLWEIVHTEPAGGETRFRLRCSQGDLQGMELDILHPFERVHPVANELQPAKAGRLREWLLYHQAFLLEQALGIDALTAVEPGRLEIAPYQLVPVMRALQMSRPRLLLADGVGLGKTIQAGLVLSELIARRRAHRILIVSPAGPLLNQWHRELRERFGLRFDAVKDWGTLQEARRSLVLGANPFDHMALCLTSIDFAKQEKVLEDLERTTWDVIVIDEAHHCVRMGRSGDFEDSRRRRLAEVLAQRSDALLLLTATPHDGYDPHFASLVQLLDPSLLDGRGSLRGDRYRRHVIRRLKKHIKDPVTGESIFRQRRVTPRPVSFGGDSLPQFTAFQETLLALVVPRLRSALRRRRFGDVLAFVALLKRSVSTARSCRNTLSVIRERYEELARVGAERHEERKQRLATLRDYQRRLERYGALSFEEEQDQATLEAEDMAAELFATGSEEIVAELESSRRETRRERDRLRRVRDVEGALGELVRLAEAAMEEDPKLLAILDEVRGIRDDEPGANILIYTEYTDSQEAVLERLEAAVKSGELDGEVLAISGPDPEHVRTEITERFQTEGGLILVSTDATAEGLNLHARCHHLVHLELPYNPNRLEQRNGRIDRYGQREEPLVTYLYLTGTFEERLLARLVAKYERQRARLTFVPNTLGVNPGDGQMGSARLLEGIAQDELALFQREPAPLEFGGEEEETTSEAYRELLAEVDRAMAKFEKSAKDDTWLGDAGLNAETKLVEEASQAKAAGEQLGGVELIRFVCDAVRNETGSAESAVWEDEDALRIRVPAAWDFGLEGLPGYDLSERVLRVTAKRDRLRDADGRSLGFLGRAHPLVRRALDRVRNVQYGGAGQIIDRRVSAARSEGTEPELLLTFLGAVESGAGREYERLLAVRAGRDGVREVFDDPGEWRPLAGADRAVAPAGLWEREFAAWGPGLETAAAQAVAERFERMAEGFVVRYREGLEAEREDLDRWLAERARDLCGAVEEAVQTDLFQDVDVDRPRWRAIRDPVERLAAFAKDGSNPAARRGEAESVLSLHRTRKADLDRRAATTTPEPKLLGLLMLVPEKRGA